MDLSMPRMNGMDALPEIKRLDPEVPVIICTAHADLATAVRAMKLGAYDYLTKPFDLELLARRWSARWSATSSARASAS